MRYIISVAMDQFVTSVSILDLYNNVVGEELKISLDLSSNTAALTELGAQLVGLMKDSGIPKEKFAGIGIGMPGFVDTNKGINYSYFDTGAHNIISYLEMVTGVSVLIDNDSSLIALAECRLGSAKHSKNAMVVNVGWGIGLGMILNGSLFRGDNGFAGEFSHIPLFTNNKICSCGKMGCLETEASLSVIAEKAIEGLNEGKTSVMKDLTLDNLEESVKTIMYSASRGDKYAVELVSEAAYKIGRGIAILIHILNPGLIILSGRGASAGRLWLAPIQHALNEHCIPKIAENVEFKISSLGNEAERLGAAALVMEHFDQKKLYKSN